VIGTIAPTTALINTTITITVNGTGFRNGDSIVTDANSQPTTFVSSTQLTCSYTTPATAQTVNVRVRNVDGDFSNGSPLTVTATVQQSQGFEAIPVNTPEEPTPDTPPDEPPPEEPTA